MTSVRESAHDPVRLERVRVEFGGQVAVDDLSFSIKVGERVAIVGATGAGKSTVLNLIAGNLAPTSGEVRVLGLEPSGRELQGRIAIAFQTPRLLPWRTALANVQTGLDVLGVPRRQKHDRSRSWLSRVGLAEAHSKYPFELSGGMKQRVSLARALVVEPELLLLDEAFSALDEYTAMTLRAEFNALIHETGVTTVIVTHSIEEAFELSDRVLVFGAPARIQNEYRRSECDFDDPAVVEAARENIHETLAGRTS